MLSRSCIDVKVKGQGHPVKKLIFVHFSSVYLTCVLGVKVKGHMGQVQRSNWPRSNKGSKQRQVGSHQCQVASFNHYIVACHLPRGSNVRWREDMGGGLPRAVARASAGPHTGTKPLIQLIPIHSHDPETPSPFCLLSLTTRWTARILLILHISD